MAEIDFIGQLHSQTKRDYVARVVDRDKAGPRSGAGLFLQINAATLVCR